LGGPARWFLQVANESQLHEAFEWAHATRLRVFVLGGGSNVVVADTGFDGLVVQIAMRGLTFEPADDNGYRRMIVAAGEPWDDVVRASVELNLAGIEALAGIPGLAGATPIQNVGAYGQEVADTIESVRVFDPVNLSFREVDARECEFGYRSSAFKHRERPLSDGIVTEVRFRLRPGHDCPIRYEEVARAIQHRGDQNVTPSVIADTVRSLRRSKSMVIDPADENRRSAGSFFTNVLLATGDADALYARAVSAGIVAREADVPRFDAGAGRVKIPAAWLIERSGYVKGQRWGAFGISSRHALALVHHGGGSTRELLEVAATIVTGVRKVFGVELAMEPVVVR
jgi:UDP-N-acetylmuramate dehydrogenase